MWAHLEAATTIENAPYNNGMNTQTGGDDSNVNEETAEGDESKVAAEANGDVGGAAADATDDTRANLNTRMTTKERI